MKIINTEKWEVTNSGTKSILLTGNKSGDPVVSELYINPLSNCTIVVKGYVSTDDTNGVTLKCVDIANLDKKDSVTSAGNYLYMVGSYYRVDIAVTGTSDIVLKWNY